MAQLVKLPAKSEEVTGSNPGQDNFVINYNYCLIYPFQFWMVAAMDGCIQCNCKRHPWLHPLTFDKILRPRLNGRNKLQIGIEAVTILMVLDNGIQYIYIHNHIVEVSSVPSRQTSSGAIQSLGSAGTSLSDLMCANRDACLRRV